MSTFQIYLNDEEKGVRLRVYYDGDTLADEHQSDWDTAFGKCIEALKNGRKKAHDAETQT